MPGSNSGTPGPGNQGPSRHSSIVELLSTPPLLPTGNGSGHSVSGSGDHARNKQHSQAHHEWSQDDDVSSMSSTYLSDTDQPTSYGASLQQEWQHVKLSQLIESNKLICIPGSVSMEEAFNTLVKHQLTSVPVESTPGDMDCLTFDYNDLNAYLLLVLNKITVADTEITHLCQSGRPVPVGEIVKLTPKNPFYKIPETENLSTVLHILGSGVHRVAITNTNMTKVKGILSQRRLVKYIWDNARSFTHLEPLLNASLQELQIGVLDTNAKPTSRQSRVISILGEEPLIMALYKMYQERISSIAVMDNQGNLIGNISVTDVKHVTRTSQYPLLHRTCRHFISVILNTRGLETGKDSFPIFHVYSTSSLARTLAKLVATKSHRLWIVQPSEQSNGSVGGLSSNSNTSSSASSTSAMPAANSHQHKSTTHSPLLSSIDDPNAHGCASTPTQNLFEKEYRTGKLIGVVSLTDILNLLAKVQSGKELDPQAARRQRGPTVRH